MTQADRVLDFLWSVAPDGATNGQIARRVGINSHQTVYMLTQQLLRQRLVRAEQAGKMWMFFALEATEFRPTSPLTSAQPVTKAGGPAGPAYRTFEALARRVMSEHYSAQLGFGTVPGVRKEFDLVSPDRTVVGDAKYLTLVGGTRLPPAKLSMIAEHVWLLEKTNAPVQFLVFGNDRAVPTLWLERHGRNARSVSFFFLTDDGRLEELRHPE